jgi:nitrate/nitrite transporter NarK
VVIAIVTADFPAAAGKAAALTMLFGGLGGMFIPFLQGVLLAESGPRAAALLIAAANLTLVGLYYLGRAAEQRQAVRIARASVPGSADDGALRTGT